jgi:hypothetical protein
LENLKQGDNLEIAVYEDAGCILAAQNKDQLWALKVDATSQSS